MEIKTIATTPYDGQKPGTSGLRKKVSVVTQENYLENFVQCIFDSLDDIKGSTLVLSGDGRYHNDVASHIILRMAAANGVKKVIVGIDFLMSTPCVSHIIRQLKAYGGIILTASHNPGGPTEDFGIKYNCANGGPAPSHLTNKMFELSKNLSQYKIAAEEIPGLNHLVSKVGSTTFGDMEIQVIDAAASYADFMATIFDFEALKGLISRDDFNMVYDSMSGVAGPFAREVLCNRLGVPTDNLLGGTPSPDFAGGHPDPNLTYAHDLVEKMGLDSKGAPLGDDSKAADVPDFGAAADGDADRNMVLGKQFFVTPSDSVAIIAANASCIPYFKDGVKGVARSMPTSAALDRVAKDLGLECNVVPTGWKYFGNLMDAGRLSICGEESFGTGSDHIREKDGMWAVLCWLSILADRNSQNGSEGKLVSVEDIVVSHWNKYGRNYYQRYDYEQVDSEKAQQMMANLAELTSTCVANETKFGDFTIASADEFCYTDPVDQSVAEHQGIRFIFNDGSRIIFRLSGTGSSGATIRLYMERYTNDSDKLKMTAAEALEPIVAIALDISQIPSLTGRDSPTVIT